MFNYPYYPYSSTQPTQVGYKVYPVASIEEAKASSVDYQGNPLFFYNKAKGEIYLKRFDPDSALVEIKKFTISDEPLKTVTFDTSKIDEEIIGIKSQINQLFSLVQPKKAVKDDEQH